MPTTEVKTTRKRRELVPLGNANNIMFKIPGINALGELEESIMSVVWHLGEARVADVHKILRPHKEYTTILSTMSTLAKKKGMLTENTSERVYVYSPAMSQREYTDKIIGAVVAELLSKYREPTLRFMEESGVQGMPRRAKASV